LATKNAVFQGTNNETAVQKCFGAGTIKTHELLRKQHFLSCLGYVLYIFPISAFLSKCPAGKKFKGNFHKNQTQKTKFLDENAAKIVLFEKKNIF
jgi:hypothetical protein